jgi:hypothetical protein
VGYLAWVIVEGIWNTLVFEEHPIKKEVIGKVDLMFLLNPKVDKAQRTLSFECSTKKSRVV